MERLLFTNSGFPLSRASNEGEALRLGICRLRPVPEVVRHIVEGDLPALQAEVAASSEALAPVRTTDGTNLSLLQVAVILNQPEVCRWLREQDISGTDGVASLQLAARYAGREVIELFRDQVGTLSAEQKKALYSAVGHEGRFENIAVLEDIGIPVRDFAGNLFRVLAWKDNREVLATLLERGVDVNYHEPDMVEPYAPTAVLSATRHGQPEVVRFLVEHGADVTIADRTGERPYTAALKTKDLKLAEYLRSLEPEEWHNRVEKERELKPFTLPQELVEMVRSEDRRLSFPEEETVTWIEFLDFLNLRPLTIRRKKYLLLCDSFEHYGDMYQVLWHGKARQLFIWDTEHHELHELGTWEDFWSDPGKAVNSIF